jgi:hypothetical protein
MTALLLLASFGALAGTGLVLIAAGMGWLPPGTPSPAAPARSGADRAARRRSAMAAGLAGLVAFVVTRWPMSVPLAVLAVLGGRGLNGSGAAPAIARLEAIAVFTEMLRDTLAGAAGLSQALLATAPIAPLAIRPALTALAARLDSGVGLAVALRRLADDLADPAADTVVACLVLAATERAQRLSDLLSALATATREEVTMRLAVEASRASARTAMRTITGFSFGLLGLMGVFARGYLEPYRTLSGQLVLALVGCIFGFGLWLMGVMVRPEPFSRLPIPEATPA